METPTSPSNLIGDLIDSLGTVAMTWQLGAIAACLAGAWLALRLLQPRLAAARARTSVAEEALRMGFGGVSIVLFPLTAWVLLLIARWVLHFQHPVHLMKIAIALVSSLVIIRIAVYVLRHALPPSTWLRGSERAIAWTMWIGATLHITGLLPELRGWLDELRLPLGKHEISLLNIIEGTLSVGITILIALWIGGLMERRVMEMRTMDANLRVVFAKLLKMVFLVLAVLIALPIVGIDITVLSVFGGAVGVGLGFGLQKIASNYVSGFIILLDRSIRIGDWITADNHYGEVRQITTRYTVVRSLSGVEAIIPNDMLVTATVLNNTYADKQLRLAVKVSVAYSTAIEPVLELLAEIASRHPRVLKEPPPNAIVTALGDNGIELELGFWIEDPEKGRQNLCSEISVAILSEFRTRRIEIPYPQREVRMLPGGAA